ncbi:hypothetical protein AVEN_180149-1 [Araneus ventricosus]|uniref:Tc1-like transposase DDE domain-containing protein n=1 Tax=Araneus ventricosus TaxID=182803 RepID=A0A4Y2D4K4_ARAVE|nr:hypothetical protein AVEN_180149-1 [Araneus ventricosus]
MMRTAPDPLFKLPNQTKVRDIQDIISFMGIRQGFVRQLRSEGKQDPGHMIYSPLPVIICDLACANVARDVAFLAPSSYMTFKSDIKTLTFCHHGQWRRENDNSTVHRAGRICDWFYDHSHTLLHFDWPAKSPDLNPIENLWDILGQRVKRRNQHPRILVGLRDQILSEWPKLDATDLQNLEDSLPNRIQVIMKSRGEVTRY